MAKVTVELPDDVIERAMTAAQGNGITMEAWLEALVEDMLGERRLLRLQRLWGSWDDCTADEILAAINADETSIQSRPA